MWSVTIPLVRPGIIAGALFAFITSFEELLIALFVSGTRAVTLPRLLWDFVRSEASPVIAVVSVLLTVFSIVAVGVYAAVQANGDERAKRANHQRRAERSRVHHRVGRWLLPHGTVVHQ